MDEYSLREALVDSYVSLNDTKAAVALLFEMIVECARRKDFQKAEAFRGRLLEIAPFALSEIIQSGEIIDQERQQSIDRDHAANWSKLYGTLSPEESNALFFELREQTVEPTGVVFSQGKCHARLYLVDRGELALLWRSGDREVVLKKIGPGEMAAADGLFSQSVCTTSLVALSRADLKVLEKDSLLQWEKTFPTLEDKLRSFVRSLYDVPALLNERQVDRRSYRRIKTPGSIMVQLLSGSGSLLGKPFRGDLGDISRGGAAFFTAIRDRKAIRALLGRPVILTIPIPGNAPPLKFIRKGSIVAVTQTPFEGYCIHVELEERFSEQEAMDIAFALRVDRR